MTGTREDADELTALARPLGRALAGYAAGPPALAMARGRWPRPPRRLMLTTGWVAALIPTLYGWAFGMPSRVMVTFGCTAPPTRPPASDAG